MATTTTENGAPSYATTGSARLDYMFKGVRDITDKQIDEYLTGAMKESVEDTLRLIFFKRDCRGGSGERKLFYKSLLWLMKDENIAHLRANIHLLPEYGSWKDYLRCFCGTQFQSEALRQITNQLRLDALALSKGERVSLAAKYAPSEGDAFDKKYGAARQVMYMMGMRPRQYRRMLTSLRSKIGIVETQMCGDDWASIDFSKVPSHAFNIYRDAFQRHQPERFSAFITKVMNGEAKINTSVLFPHDIGREYMNARRSVIVNDAIEAQWRQYLCNKKLTLKVPSRALAVVDVSGSMDGTPMEVAVMMGIFLAEMSPETSWYHRKFITFSQNPTLEVLKGDTLRETINNMMSSSWGMSTNIMAVFQLILSGALSNGNKEDTPTDVFIFSDMQFDEAERYGTNFDAINEMYRKAEVSRPNLHFWNLRGSTTDFPTQNDSGVTLLSGSSPDLLQFIIDGDVPTPMKMLRRILDSPRYQAVKPYSSEPINVQYTETVIGNLLRREASSDDEIEPSESPSADESDLHLGSRDTHETSQCVIC